jgi:hypothetical protein
MFGQRRYSKQIAIPRTILQIEIAIASVMIGGLVCQAGTSQQRASAAIAVVRAALEIADEQPVLPDSNETKMPGLENTAASDQDVFSSQKAAANASDSQRSLGSNLQVPKSSATSVTWRKMRIEVAKQDILSDILPAQLVIGGWEQGCPACIRLEHDVKTTLTPHGWKIGDRSTDQIQFVHLPQTETAPRITLYQNGNVIKTWDQYVDPGTISRALRTAWDDAPPLGQSVMSSAQAGMAGTLHAQSQIRTALAWWRDKIGEQNKGSMIWDRSGAQTFPLLAKGDWSATALFGTAGHIALSAKDARQLPIDALGFGYQIRGPDVLIDADPINVAGLADHLGGVVKPQAAVPQPVGFIDPLTAWSIFSMVQGIYELLYPSCDLQLPGQVSASGTLVGETLSIDFRKGPTIKLVALFTFQLTVQRIEITESSVRLLFSGSRLVKERTFSVE